MADNYRDTAYRMYESSDILFQRQQWFNANYLAGYIAECYCKLVLGTAGEHGHSFSHGHRNLRDFGHRITELSDETAFIGFGGGTVSAYCLDMRMVCPNILNNWNPNRRYEGDGSALNSEGLALDIHAEREKLMDMIMKMEIDGVIV
ncbi:hypothetical protein IMSAGC019_03517 [Lachnospiraceae bacterium]|nr:hypothetical protein IMSAGC019_03517 [Lachnospiraceae bacterium]